MGCPFKSRQGLTCYRINIVLRQHVGRILPLPSQIIGFITILRSEGVVCAVVIIKTYLISVPLTSDGRIILEHELVHLIPKGMAFYMRILHCPCVSGRICLQCENVCCCSSLWIHKCNPFQNYVHILLVETPIDT